MADDGMIVCPFGDDGKGAGCIILITPSEPHTGPHMVIEQEEDEDDG